MDVKLSQALVNVLAEYLEHREIYEIIQERKANDNGIRYTLEDVFRKVKEEEAQ